MRETDRGGRERARGIFEQSLGCVDLLALSAQCDQPLAHPLDRQGQDLVTH
jgi:hypothetical protein